MVIVLPLQSITIFINIIITITITIIVTITISTFISITLTSTVINYNYNYISTIIINNIMIIDMSLTSTLHYKLLSIKIINDHYI